MIAIKILEKYFRNISTLLVASCHKNLIEVRQLNFLLLFHQQP